MENIDRILNSDEVISIDNEKDNILISHSTYKVDEFLHRLRGIFGCDQIDKWLDEGVPCKILSPNQNWQKGKIKICLQFVPDQPESVLDDIRQNIDKE